MTAYLSDAELMQQTAWETRASDGVAADFAHGAEENGQRKTPGAGKQTGVSLTAPSAATGGRASTMIVHRPADRINAPRRAAR